MRVAFSSDYRKITFYPIFQPTLAIYHGAVFTNSHPMNHRYRMQTYERTISGIQDVPIDIKTVGVGTIENYTTNAVFGASLKNIMEGRNICLKPCANILNVK